MAVRELVTRKFAGVGEDGRKIYANTVFTGRPVLETMDDWTGIRRLALRAGAPAVRAVAGGLLDAIGGDAKARKAAVAAGERLDDRERFTVLRVLREWERIAGHGAEWTHDAFPPAVAPVAALLAAWRGRWGDADPREQPPAPRQRGLARVRPA